MGIGNWLVAIVITNILAYVGYITCSSVNYTESNRSNYDYYEHEPALGLNSISHYLPITIQRQSTPLAAEVKDKRPSNTELVCVIVAVTLFLFPDTTGVPIWYALEFP